MDEAIGQFNPLPFVQHDEGYEILAEVDENTEGTVLAVEQFYTLVETQYKTQQACSAVEIFLLAAVFAAICARGLFKW